MRDIDVVFFIEHADRELDAVREIAKDLKEQGVSSLLASVFFHGHLLVTRFRPRVCVFPYIMSAADWPARLIYEMYGDRIIYVNMNWEQLLSPANRQYKRPKNDFQRNWVQHTVWDDGFRDFLVENGVRPDHVHVLGNPADELLRRQLCRRDELRRQLARLTGLDQRQAWLFFPMNFGWAFDSQRLIQSRVEAGYDPKEAVAYKAFSDRYLVAFVQWVCNQADGFRDRSFIIRPHPSTTPEQYREAFQRIRGRIPENVVFSRLQTVREWVPASDAVFSSWSTVVWDAHRVGIPSYLLAMYPRPGWLNADWKDRVPNLRTEAEFSEVVARTDLVRVNLESAAADPIISRYADFLVPLCRSARSDAGSPARRSLKPLTLMKLAKVFAYNQLFAIPSVGPRVNQRVAGDYFRWEICH